MFLFRPRRFGAFVLLMVFGSTGQAADTDKNENSKPASVPGIILLMGDDHGWDETGYNGHRHLQTPVLDQMAAGGLRLDRFYSAHPSCSPTRGSVLTGRHPNRYGTWAPGYSIRPEEVTIADLLGDAGYVCGHFGKWHLGPVKASSPTNPGAMGFDHWVSHDNFFELDPWLSRNGRPPERFPGEGSQVVIDQTIEFLKEAKDDAKPFLAVVWFGSPHEPYSGLPADLALYDNVVAKYADQTMRLTSNQTGLPVTRPLGEVLQERYAEITAMDRSIGTLRDWLADNGLRENTLLWYCGDNGTPGDGIVTSPLRGQKGQHFDGGVRVPAVIEWPAAIGQPKSNDIAAVTSDILPTLCDLTGASKDRLGDRPIDGISLKPMIDGNMKRRGAPIGFWTFPTSTVGPANPYIDPELQSGTTPLVKKMRGLNTRNFRNQRYTEIKDAHFGGTRAVLGDRYKLLIQDHRDGESESLFDLRDDPAEQNDLSAKFPDRVDRLREFSRTWQESVLKSLQASDYR